ncbi:MAG: DUF349 domain-containing protein [Actinomycetia bacterium]|nr:DUF349 domain-containing protein [Actinomycetes bacterium]MCH9800140.1 DUF349 domain-containing protein [Actinomycetes bacterium]
MTPTPTGPPRPTPTGPVPARSTGKPASPPDGGNDHGRIADDGTIYVQLPDGTERSVGQWAAGDPAAGLAHFRRRYQDLLVELDLTTTRLRNGQATPDQAVAVVERMKAALTEPAFVGDIAALTAQVDALAELVGVRRVELTEAKEQARSEALARRAAIADEAEKLANSEQWKVTGQRFRELLDEWKALPRFDKSEEQKQWDRFKAARSTFDRARKQFFAKLDEQRADAVVVKDQLIQRAQALSNSTDWGPTSRAYRDLMAEWKAAPRAARDQEERLWQAFRAAQDVFFDARSKVFSAKDDEERENLKAKQDILDQIDKLFPVKDPQATRRSLSALMEKWDSIGFVPRDAKAGLERKLRAAERKLRDSEQAEWKRTDPAARALAESTTKTFRSSVEKIEADLAKATEAGDQSAIAKAQASLESTQALLDAAEAALAEYSDD